jgi:hypothetical protein
MNSFPCNDYVAVEVGYNVIRASEILCRYKQALL